jgi:hypothetical protein
MAQLAAEDEEIEAMQAPSASGTAALAKGFELAERRFDSLTTELHIPFLEAKLYRKYFILVRTPQRLESLNAIIGTMEEHKKRTLRILKMIHERESVLHCIQERASEFGSGKISTLEVQTVVLQLLYLHQQVTAKIVDAITEWRSQLTRPYPFAFQGGNYLTKILADCAFIDRSELHSVLPLRLSQFPLCSNITSLSLFATTTLTYPMKPKKSSSAQPSSANQEEAARLKGIEAQLFNEGKLQKDLLRELSAISASGSFVPILNLQSLIPNCCSGIRISNKNWDEKLNSVLSQAMKDLTLSGNHSSSSPSKNEEGDL